MPQVFKTLYPTTRVIIDCTEIPTERPSSLALNSKCYSTYKSTHTFKSLVGIAPHGALIFISSLYTGSMSDVEITRLCGLVELLEEGDSIMTDKGFVLNNVLSGKGITVNTPPFLMNKGQITKQEVEETQTIARLRIHVERHIRRVKEFHLFDRPIPLSMVGSIIQIWTVANILTLFRECNSKHLGKVKEAKSEAEIQAILAHHLFSQLAPTGKYVIDGRCALVDLKKCLACKADLVYGDTSIGNPAYCHGYPDILLDKSTVKVDMDESCCETEETQEYEWPETVAKKQRLLEQTNGTNGEGSNLTLNSDIFTTCEDQFFKTEKALRQSFAQTITNAFYQVKQNPKLQNLYIPSFLASDNKVRIIMYNCEQGRLYISEDMYLFDTLCDHGLNVGTIVSIWLALNFEIFQNEVDEEDLTTIALKKSSFQEKITRYSTVGLQTSVVQTSANEKETNRATTSYYYGCKTSQI
ncbi:unnamed protein product [Mytilus coruscus]|uniref:DDE Tnp4 domain-containing protein n=1 Tax=Mytilus coruscus TaxID=42192 RepID=A0A6J8DV19_MYTCO|nr:unnamed protein product [Mytilus coruscus]